MGRHTSSSRKRLRGDKVSSAFSPNKREPEITLTSFLCCFLAVALSWPGGALLLIQLRLPCLTDHN